MGWKERLEWKGEGRKKKVEGSHEKEEVRKWGRGREGMKAGMMTECMAKVRLK